MKKIKCVNGHFFDQERFSSCPICGASAVVLSGLGGINGCVCGNGTGSDLSTGCGTTADAPQMGQLENRS